MPDNFGDKPSELPSNSADSSALDELRRQIDDHRKHDSQQSYLKRAVGSLYGGDERSLEELQSLQAEAERMRKAGDTAGLAQLEKQIGERVKTDREAVGWQEEVSHYGSGFLKTAALFARGKIGLAGTVALYALDQMNPNDSVSTQLADMTLGGAKGGLLKGAFHFVGDKPVGVAAKGIGLGVTSRALELGLTRSTYIDRSTGEASLGRGLTDTVRGMLNTKALAADVVIFAGAHGLLKGANSMSLGAIERSPMLTTMFTGTTFGLSSGATGEIMRQQSAGESFDLGKIVKRSLIQGTIDTFAAAPGGIQADPHVRGQIRDSMRSGSDSIRRQVDAVREGAMNFVDSVNVFGVGGFEPAFAMAGGGRLPAETWLSRPARTPEKTDGIFAMSDGPTGLTSGANIEGILSGATPREPVREPVREAPKPVTPEPATAETGTRSTTGDGKDTLVPPEPVRDADGTVFAVEKFGIQAAVKVRGQEQALAYHDFRLAMDNATREGATPQDKQQLFTVLREHPEMEPTFREYSGHVFDQLTRTHRPGEFPEAELQEMKRSVHLLDQFYKPQKPRIFTDSKAELSAFQQMWPLLQGLKNPQMHAHFKSGLFQLLGNNAWFRPVAERYAATCNDPVVLKVLDQYFGTKHSQDLQALQDWRTATRGQPLVKQPRIVLDAPPPPAAVTQEVAASETAVDRTAARVEEPAARVEDPAARVEDGSKAGGPPVPATPPDSPFAALAKARPQSLAADVPAAPPERTDVPRPEAVNPADLLSLKPASTPADSPYGAVAPRETVSASELAKGLTDGDLAVQAKTARILADHLDKLTDPEFESWKQVVSREPLYKFLLSREDIARVPTHVLKAFLARPEVTAQGTPEWAQPYMEGMEQRRGGSVRDRKLEDRFALLQKTMDVFKDSPDLAVRLLELGAADKAIVSDVQYIVGNPRLGQAYKDLFRAILPNATSAEPVKQLLVFLKARNSEGAFAAMERLRPQEQGSIAEIENRIIAEKEQLAEDIDLDAVAEEARIEHKALNREANERFEKAQTLLLNIMTGNITPPPGQGGGPGGGRGGPRGPRPDRGGPPRQ